MNLINIIWAALIAEPLGLLVTFFIWKVMAPITDVLVTAGSGEYYAAYMGFFAMTVVFIFVIPLMVAMSDEEGGALKKLITNR